MREMRISGNFCVVVSEPFLYEITLLEVSVDNPIVLYFLVFQVRKFD